MVQERGGLLKRISFITMWELNMYDSTFSPPGKLKPLHMDRSNEDKKQDELTQC